MKLAMIEAMERLIDKASIRLVDYVAKTCYDLLIEMGYDIEADEMRDYYNNKFK